MLRRHGTGLLRASGVMRGRNDGLGVVRARVGACLSPGTSRPFPFHRRRRNCCSRRCIRRRCRWLHPIAVARTLAVCSLSDNLDARRWAGLDSLVQRVARRSGPVWSVAEAPLRVVALSRKPRGRSRRAAVGRRPATSAQQTERCGSDRDVEMRRHDLEHSCADSVGDDRERLFIGDASPGSKQGWPERTRMRGQLYAGGRRRSCCNFGRRCPWWGRRRRLSTRR